MRERGEGGERLEIFVISDGTGETASSAVRAAMTQLPSRWRLRSFSDVRKPAQVNRVVEQAAAANAIVVYTIVDEALAEAVRQAGPVHEIPTIDLLGPLISTIASHGRIEPEFRPGLLHGFSDDYFKRVEAVEFAVRHDDGANLHTLFDADIVLTGVSRTSKTPLSMYLAQRGFKTGNVPLVPGMAAPAELVDLDSSKVFGLLVDDATLIEIRRSRIRALRASPYTTYADPDGVREELIRARRLFRENGWRTVQITGRAVEENAARILELLQAGRDAQD